MIRAVIDTSVFIRYLIRPSAAIRVLIEGLWLEDQVQVITAPELLAELQRVLARESIRRFIQPAEGQALLDSVLLKAEILPALGSIPSFTRDPKDDKFIACALARNAQAIITLDEDLLVLGSVGAVQILTPQAFIAGIERK